MSAGEGAARFNAKVAEMCAEHAATHHLTCPTHGPWCAWWTEENECPACGWTPDAGTLARLDAADRAERWANTPTVVIHLGGGLVQDIDADQPVRVIILDSDTDLDRGDPRVVRIAGFKDAYKGRDPFYAFVSAWQVGEGIENAKVVEIALAAANLAEDRALRVTEEEEERRRTRE